MTLRIGQFSKATVMMRVYRLRETGKHRRPFANAGIVGQTYLCVLRALGYK